MKSYKEISCL